jgi:hypothetical protein
MYPVLNCTMEGTANLLGGQKQMPFCSKYYLSVKISHPFSVRQISVLRKICAQRKYLSRPYL